LATNEGRVYFALDGEELDPDLLTELLGISPTSTKRIGEKIPGKIPKVNSWLLSTENKVNEYINVYDMANEIVKLLIPKKQVIIDAIQKYNLSSKLEVVLWFSINEKHATPAIGFEVETIKFLGEVGAYIDIDTYKH